jgi:hypothetical protein
MLNVKKRLRLLAGRLRPAACERGDAVNWLIITLGVAIAAAAVVSVLRPAIEHAGQQIATLLGGG